MSTKGQMNFERWQDDTSRFSLAIRDSDEKWVFLANRNKGNRLLNDGGRELYHSVKVGPSWRHWFGMLGPVEYVDDDGMVIVRVERFGWGGNLKITAGEISVKLLMTGGFMKTQYQCRLIHITMTESQARVAAFEASPTLNPLAALLITAHLVSYHHKA